MITIGKREFQDGKCLGLPEGWSRCWLPLCWAFVDKRRFTGRQSSFPLPKPPGYQQLRLIYNL